MRYGEKNLFYITANCIVSNNSDNDRHKQEKETRIEKTRGDYAHTIITTGAPAIAPIAGNVADNPLIGTAAAVGTSIFTLVISKPLEKRLNKWREEVSDGLKKLQDEKGVNIESLANNEHFITTITQATLIAIRNHQKQKIDALQNAILNAATSNDADTDLELMFLNYIDIFTPSHLEVLEYLAANEFNLKGASWRIRIDEEIYKAIISVKPKFRDINFFNVIMKDLIDHELIDPTDRNVQQDTYFDICLTPMGKKFLNYITFTR